MTPPKPEMPVPHEVTTWSQSAVEPAPSDDLPDTHEKENA